VFGGFSILFFSCLFFCMGWDGMDWIGLDWVGWLHVCMCMYTPRGMVFLRLLYFIGGKGAMCKSPGVKQVGGRRNTMISMSASSPNASCATVIPPL
jgi:hypothetical protein